MINYPQTIKVLLVGFIILFDDKQPRQGLCQICHSLTTYYTVDDANDTQRPGVSCFACHTSTNGFAPTGP